jgi:hypothetical protein
MIIQRREFLLGTAFLATVPVLERLAPFAAMALPSIPVLPDSLSPQIAERATDENSTRLKIHGWEPILPNGDEAFISINRSWRAAWR